MSKTLRVFQPADIVTFDWTVSNQEVDSPILSNLQEGLFKNSDENRIERELAQSFTVDATGKIYRIVLKPGIVWSDGVPLKAQHFIDAWKRLLSPITASPYGYLFHGVAGAQDFAKGVSKDFNSVGVRAVDSVTLEVRLLEPVSNWLYTLTQRPSFPIREDLIKKDGNLWTKPGNLVNLGPFSLESRDVGKNIVLRRNPKYYKPRSGLDRIEYVIESEEKAKEDFLAGKLDVIFRADEKLLKTFKGRSELHWLTPIRTKRLSINVKQFPFSDSKTRVAIAMVLDRKKLAAELGEGYWQGGSLVPPAFPGYSKSGGLSFKVADARKVFRKSAAALGASKVTILVPYFNERAVENMKTAEFLKTSISSLLHLEVTLQSVDDPVSWSVLARSERFSMILHDWKADSPQAENYYNLYSAQSKHNIQWKNPEYNAALNEALEERDSTRQNLLFKKADDILLVKEAAVVPLFYASDGVLISPWVKGIHFNAFNVYDLSDVQKR